MTLSELTEGISGFERWSHAKKMTLFGWHLHNHKSKRKFSPSDIRSCYDSLYLDKPANVSTYLNRLSTKKPKDMLKSPGGFCLSSSARKSMDQRFASKSESVKVRKLLSDLTGKLSDEAESKFLEEAVVCFKHGAFRAAIVMTWNLAFFHFTDWIYTDHLDDFNAAVAVRYQKNKDQISKHDEFGDLFKEFQVIEIARTAKIISRNVKKILNEKLVKRNMAAHPSNVEITKVQAEEVIIDLVNNVILKLD